MKRKRDWYRIADKADGPARVDIYDEIGLGFAGSGVTAAGFVGELAALKGDLEVHINSPGGNVFDGIAIYNALAQRPGRVTTVVDGLAASAASFIAQAGKQRIVAPGAMVMIHDAMGLSVGNAADMREMAGLLDKASGNLASIYAAHTGRPEDGWRDAMRAETWYTAQEAVTAGLADRLAERPVSQDALAAVAKFDLSVFARVPDWVTNRDGCPVCGGATAVRNEKYSTDDRKRMASSGEAMPDGSYPIADAEDLDNAIHAVGRGGADHDAIRRHIISRAHALGLSSRIPDNWGSDGSMQDHADPELTADWAPSMFDNIREALKGAASA